MSIFAVGLTLLSAFTHASWNFLARKSHETDQLLHSGLVIIAVGIIPAFIIGFYGASFPTQVWINIPISGTFLAIYYLGIIQGYRSGEFTVVYPIARALPVLIIALSDIVLGFPPTMLGWAGIFLVSIGLIMSPLDSVSRFSLAAYKKKATLWAILAAVGITGYSFIDSASADMMQPGVATALRYFIFQTFFSILIYLFILRSLPTPIHWAKGLAAWRRPAIIALLVTCGYTLVLLAYQLTSETSYVVAIRQFSIVIGVLMAVILLREAVPKIRILAAAIITSGVFIIALAG
ncbi:MAG: EamA family transporter [Anaerolineales bacterium]|jgi:drug/metabolite transporter (DMT)-like permease|nr:EamA family transporter [Anaerolineales bacterium]